MTDIAALKGMLDYDKFIRYSGVLFGLKNREREHVQILNSIRDYYKAYPENKFISVDELEQFFFHHNPMVNKESYKLVFDTLRTLKLDNQELLDDILNRLIEVHTCSQIAQVALNVAEGKKVEGIEQIEHLLSEYKNSLGAMTDPFEAVCRDDAHELFKDEDDEGIKWSLGFLNATLGPLRSRTLGHIFARPDTGKTSLALNQLAKMAYDFKDTSKKLLFLNNEEDIRIVRGRLYCCLLGWTEAQIKADKDQANELFAKKGGDNLLLIGGVNHIRLVEQHVHTIKPDIVVIDQGPKVNFPGKELTEVDRKQRLYNRYREMAKEYDCIFISLGQADSASEGRKYLTLNNLDGSKVGIPGELDWCLAIGRIHDPGYEDVRYFNICKNKLTGRYRQTEVLFDRKICRYTKA